MKSLIGTVVANKMAKTVIVEIARTYKHPLYKKAIKRSTRLKVHSDSPVAVGTVVKIDSTRPISKEKHFKIAEVMQKENI